MNSLKHLLFQIHQNSFSVVLRLPIILNSQLPIKFMTKENINIANLNACFAFFRKCVAFLSSRPATGNSDTVY